MPTATTAIEHARQLQQEIVELRRHIHKYPELSFSENETAALAAAKLRELGFAVKEHIALTGVTADLGSGSNIIAIRADMDGLPIDEANDVPYRSSNKGAMHACGHDAHVSCALAAAKILAADRNSWSSSGTVRMLMQPAEEHSDGEGKSGAMRMIEEGVLNGVAAIIGQHVDSSLPSGKVGILAGPIMAAADSFSITIKGKGGHGAYPESAIDAIVIASQFVQAAQQIVSRRISALEPAVLTIGSFHSSSTRGNVIAEEVHLEGTIRSFSEQTRKQLMSEIERTLEIVKVLGGDYSIAYEMGYPATVNDTNLADLMRQTAVDLIGKENVVEVKPKTWAEDFSFYGQKVPAAFMFLGVEIAGSRRSHHSPYFDIDESGLYIGAAILAETAKRLVLSQRG